MARSTNLNMRGTKGRDASPKSSQRPLMGAQQPKAPKGVEYTGLGTPLGGKPPEAKKPNTTQGTGSIDPAMFNVDLHAIRVFSSYMNGKRAGPDWLHKRIEDADRKRFDDGLEMMRRS